MQCELKFETVYHEDELIYIIKEMNNFNWINELPKIQKTQKEFKEWGKKSEIRKKFVDYIFSLFPENKKQSDNIIIISVRYFKKWSLNNTISYEFKFSVSYENNPYHILFLKKSTDIRDGVTQLNYFQNEKEIDTYNTFMKIIKYLDRIHIEDKCSLELPNILNYNDICI